MRQLSGTIWVMVIGGLALTIVLGLFVYRFYQPETSVSTFRVVENEALVNRAVSIGFSDADSDEDGLRDWEETLWGTDKNNPDTDGDGTSDGDEVDQNRNPTKAGPDDAYIPGEQGPTGETDENLSSTDQFARQFFAEYVRMRESGTLSNEAIRDYTLNTVIKSTVAAPHESKDLYTADNVQIVINENEEAIRQYGNRVASILLKYQVSEEDDAEILLSALQYERIEYIDAVAYNARMYTEAAADISEIPVPQSASTVHLAILNALAGTGKTLEDMAAVNKDPVRSLAAVAQYVDVLGRLADAYKSTETYLKQSGISYEPHEPGYGLLYLSQRS